MSDLNKELIEQLIQRIDLLEKAMKKQKKSKMADKDYDGDGKIESGTEEYMGSRDKAIKKAMGKKIEEALDRVGGNVNLNSPSIRSLASKIEKSDMVNKVLNKLNEGTDMNRKSFRDHGTKIQLSENIVFGGFPRVIKEGEESESLAQSSGNPHGELEKHIGTLSNFGQQLHKGNHPNRERFGKALNAFMDGNFNNADELIAMGADPAAVGNYIKIKTSPEYKAQMTKVQSEIKPESMGYGRPGSGSRYTGD
jgi:hypothetical protein